MSLHDHTFDIWSVIKGVLSRMCNVWGIISERTHLLDVTVDMCLCEFNMFDLCSALFKHSRYDVFVDTDDVLRVMLGHVGNVFDVRGVIAQRMSSNSCFISVRMQRSFVEKMMSGVLYQAVFFTRLKPGMSTSVVYTFDIWSSVPRSHI